MHTLDSNSEIGNEKWLDWIMHQSRDWDLIVKDRVYNKPVLNEEFYYENSGAGATHLHHVDADTLRKAAWKVMTAGASGLAYANTGTYNSRSQPFKGLNFTDSRGAHYMTYLYDFWRATSYWKLLPSSNSKSDFVMWSPGEEYVVYFENGKRRNIYIHSGKYKYRWYDPRTGLWSCPWIRVCSKGQEITFIAPDSKDWVLYLIALGESEDSYSF